jgi:hypothetical protein
MIGNTASCAWWCTCTTTYPDRFITDTITAKLARLAAIAGSTPGRRRISASGAAAPGGGAPCWAPIWIAISRVSGRTSITIDIATSAITAAASHGTVSTSGSTFLPANIGLNTAGPSIAPNTDPNRT